MVFQFGQFRIDVDVEKTRKFYRETSQTLTEGCDCINCQNFVRAYEGFDPQIKEFFETLGVDICKAPDMSVFYGTSKSNTLHYEGWCHLCGTILSGENRDEVWTYAVTDTCRVSFREHCDLLKADFPRPVFQMDVQIEVPWLFEDIHHDLMM